jgi:hypothetical protein
MCKETSEEMCRTQVKKKKGDNRVPIKKLLQLQAEASKILKSQGGLSFEKSSRPTTRKRVANRVSPKDTRAVKKSNNNCIKYSSDEDSEISSDGKSTHQAKTKALKPAPKTKKVVSSSKDDNVSIQAQARRAIDEESACAKHQAKETVSDGGTRKRDASHMYPIGEENETWAQYKQRRSKG